MTVQEETKAEEEVEAQLTEALTLTSQVIPFLVQVTIIQTHPQATILGRQDFCQYQDYSCIKGVKISVQQAKERMIEVERPILHEVDWTKKRDHIIPSLLVLLPVP